MSATPLSRWSFLGDNHKLHGVISHRLGERGLSGADVEKALKISPYKFQHYLDGDAPNVSNHELMKVMEYLGIEVDLTIELK